jgi:hypothetical protein
MRTAKTAIKPCNAYSDPCDEDLAPSPTLLAPSLDHLSYFLISFDYKCDREEGVWIL